jgi:hypothetical protein
VEALLLDPLRFYGAFPAFVFGFYQAMLAGSKPGSTWK